MGNIKGLLRGINFVILDICKTFKRKIDFFGQIKGINQA
jgi:hypothetical protein